MTNLAASAGWMLIACLALARAGDVSAAPAHAVPRGKAMLQPFNYRGVSLDGGTLRRQSEEVREYYLRLPNDDLLRGYRLRQVGRAEGDGEPTRPAQGVPGMDMGGVYLSHNPFGQILSGLARFYAATGDEACKEKAEALVAGWAECLRPDGSFAEPGQHLLPYFYDKLVCGLVDVYAYCGTDQARTCLGRITDWAIKHLDRKRAYTDVTSPEGGEWYTLSENLYRAYLVTGEQKYRDFARVWEYREYWDHFAEGRDIFSHPQPFWYHAYSHVNTLSSLAASYLVNGDPRDLAALCNAYDFLWGTQLWATGGYGPNESLVPPGGLARMLGETANHFETQCGSWAGFKLSKYLICLTGDARYGDWTELLVINGIGASIPMSPRGQVFYYSDYSVGGASKHNIGVGWACCTGTRPQAVADYHDLVYFHAPRELYVNLFAPSTVIWEGVQVVQRTRFPEEETVRFAVHLRRPREFALNLRRPGWLAAPAQLWVNGRPVSARATSRHWLTIRRTWREGDTVELRLPMGWRLSRVDPAAQYPVALMYGPVTMAVRPEAGGNPSRCFDFARLARTLRPVPGQPLAFRPRQHPTVLVRPFYQVPEGERYFVYLDPVRCPVRVSYRELTFSPGWTEYSEWRATNVVGASAECMIEADRIYIEGFRYDDAGMMAVEVDGKRVAVLDQYGPHRGEPASWPVELGPGRHAVRLVPLAERNPASQGQFVNVAAVRGEREGS